MTRFSDRKFRTLPEIRLLSRSKTSAIAVTLHQKEDINIDGERKNTRFAGNPSKSPEQILEEREISNSLSSAMARLTSADQELAEQIFDAVLKIHHYKDQEDLIRHIVLHIENKVSESKVKELFMLIANNIRDL